VSKTDAAERVVIFGRGERLVGVLAGLRWTAISGGDVVVGKG
jgi:hypothetical protein